MIDDIVMIASDVGSVLSDVFKDELDTVGRVMPFLPGGKDIAPFASAAKPKGLVRSKERTAKEWEDPATLAGDLVNLGSWVTGPLLGVSALSGTAKVLKTGHKMLSTSRSASRKVKAAAKAENLARKDKTYIRKVANAAKEAEDAVSKAKGARKAYTAAKARAYTRGAVDTAVNAYPRGEDIYQGVDSVNRQGKKRRKQYYA